MKEQQTRYIDVKPSELKKRDRIHTAAGMYEITNKVVDGNLTTITMTPLFDPSEEPAYLTVHKSVRFTIMRRPKK